MKKMRCRLPRRTIPDQVRDDKKDVPEGGEFHIEVRVENETVWLTQAQNRAKRVSQNQACLIL